MQITNLTKIITHNYINYIYKYIFYLFSLCVEILYIFSRTSYSFDHHLGTKTIVFEYKWYILLYIDSLIIYLFSASLVKINIETLYTFKTSKILLILICTNMLIKCNNHKITICEKIAVSVMPRK